ncbi:unnamed protein product [Trichobilharzia regenti]|nr:unnamed protein product [Trichobilharzia regenti]
MQYNITTWPYFFSPWDLLMGCGKLSSGKSDSVLCGVSKVAGIASAYILPFITIMNLAANIMTSIIFLYAHKSSTRQTVYLGFFAIVDLFYCFILAILYYIPSRGIPYASNARFYFFIDYQSAFSFSSLPGVVSYFLSAFSVFAEDVVTILYNLFTALALRDIFWCLMPLQAVFNTIVYLCRLKYYRHLFISILKYKNIRAVTSDTSE